MSAEASQNRCKIGIAGATGVMGRELLASLESHRIPVGELICVAGDASVGEEIEYCGVLSCIEKETATLLAADLIFLCTPAEASWSIAREALQAGVPCFDFSNAFVEKSEVPLAAPGLSTAVDLASTPLLRIAGGPALACAPVLRALKESFPITSIQVVSLEPAAGFGRRGMEWLSRSTIDVFNQSDEVEEEDCSAEVAAFDCLPSIGSSERSGANRYEEQVAKDLQRLGGLQVPCEVHALRIPTFCGNGIVLQLQSEAPVELEALAATLSVAPGLCLQQEGELPASTRESTGHDEIQVARLRAGVGDAPAISMWLCADVQKLSAENALRSAFPLLGVELS